MKPIIHTPNQTLTSPAKQVKKIDKRVRKIIADMKQALAKADEPKGVGLAAPQIGISLQIFIIWPKREQPMQVFINPQYLSKSKHLTKQVPDRPNPLEGCLSIPQVWGIVKRYQWVKISFLDEKGNKQEKKFTGFPATIVQHEMDHIKGTLFTQRVIEQQGTLYKPGKNAAGEKVFEPVDI